MSRVGHEAATGLVGVNDLELERLTEGLVDREVGTASGFFLQDLHLGNLSDLAGIGARRGQLEH